MSGRQGRLQLLSRQKEKGEQTYRHGEKYIYSFPYEKTLFILCEKWQSAVSILAYATGQKHRQRQNSLSKKSYK